MWCWEKKNGARTLCFLQYLWVFLISISLTYPPTNTKIGMLLSMILKPETQDLIMSICWLTNKHTKMTMFMKIKFFFWNWMITLNHICSMLFSQSFIFYLVRRPYYLWSSRSLKAQTHIWYLHVLTWNPPLNFSKANENIEDAEKKRGSGPLLFR